MKLSKEWLGLSIVIFLPKVLGLLISIYLYRAYSAEDIGVYANVVTISLWFCYLLDSGASDFFISKKTEKTDNYDFYYLSRLFLFLVILFSIGIYSIFSKVEFIGTLIVIYAFSSLIRNVSAHFYRLRDSYSEFSKFEVPRLFVTNLTRLIALLADVSIEFFIYIFFGVELLSMLFHWPVIKYCLSLRIKHKFKELFLFFKLNMLSYFNYVAIFFSYIVYFESDKLVVLTLLGATDLGYYNLAYLMINIGLIPASVFWARYLVIAKNNLESGHDKDKSATAFIILGVTLSVLSCVLLPYIYKTLYPEKFGYISDLITVFSLYFVFRYFNVVQEAHLVIRAAESAIIKCRAMGCIINVSLNMLLIKDYGLILAAVTTVLTESLMSLMYLYLNKKRSLE